MNKKLQDYAKQDLRRNLAKCTEKQKLMFKRMYAKGNLDLPMKTVIDNMEMEHLDRAMRQVQRTLDRSR